MIFALFALAATVSWNFEGGSADKVEQISERHFRVYAHGQTDQDGRNRQASWYYFRVDNVKPGVEYTFDMVGLPGEYNYQPNKGAITKDTVPVISTDDGKTWRYLPEAEYDAAEPRLRFRARTATETSFRIAHVPPYTNENLEQLRKLVKREQVIGKSVEGRPLYLWTIEGGSKPRATVWLMFRQHSWEAYSSWVGDAAVRSLLKDARGIRWKILPLADPDGVAHGGVRFNRNGFDLNRNWDVVDPVKMPEIAAQRGAIASWLKSGGKVDLFYSLHNTETAEYLEAMSPEHRDLAERFFTALEQTGRFRQSRPLFYAAETTTPGKPGRMTVIQGLWRDFHIPGFLMEQRISSKPGIADRLQFGELLVSTISGLFR